MRRHSDIVISKNCKLVHQCVLEEELDITADKDNCNLLIEKKSLPDIAINNAGCNFSFKNVQKGFVW